MTKAKSSTPFAARVGEALERRGLALRELCRLVDLDPSFFSKVLSGKRSPPMEEQSLRRIAEALDINAAELIVAAGRIPREWAAVCSDPEVFRRVHMVVGGTSADFGRHGASVVTKRQAPSTDFSRHGALETSRHAAKGLPYGGGRNPANAGLAEELL